MKKERFNLISLELKELTQNEINEVNGGTFSLNPWVVAGGALAYIAKADFDDWQCFKDGLAGKTYNHQAHK